MHLKKKVLNSIRRLYMSNTLYEMEEQVEHKFATSLSYIIVIFNFIPI